MSTSNLFPESWGIQEIADAFPDQQVSFGQQVQGAYYGETIRGMMHVSPLAEKKMTDLSLQEVISRYFPDAKPKQGSDTTVYCDVNSIFEGISRAKGNFIYNNSNTNAFTLYVFYSTDAIKLAEAYECLKIDKQQVVFFIEDNTGDSSERYAAVKISDDLAVSLKNGLKNDLKRNSNVYEAVQRVLPGMTDEDIREVLDKGYLEYKATQKIVDFAQAGFYLTGLFLTATMPLFGPIFFGNANLGSKAFSTAADFINKAKFDDYRWNPEAKRTKSDGSDDSSYDPARDFNPVFFPGAEKLMKSGDGILTDKINNGIKELKALLSEQDATVRSLLGIDGDKREGMQGYIYIKYAAIITGIEDTLDAFTADDMTAIARGGIRAVNAFLCGVWNGLVDAVSGIFLLIKYIFDAISLIQNAATQLPVLTEHIDNIMQTLAKIEFSKIIAYFKQKITDAEGDFYLPYIPIAYFCGAVYGFIIALAIEIAIGILVSGGVLSVAAIAEKLAEMFASIFRAGASLAKGAMSTIKRVAVKTSKAVFAMLSEITALLRKGTDEFYKIIDLLFTTFKRGGSKLDDWLIAAIKLLKQNQQYRESIEYTKLIKRPLSKFLVLEQQAAINLYTKSYYKMLNKALRKIKGSTLTAEFKAMQEVLDDALDKLPNFDYAGMLMRSAKFSEKEIKKMFRVGEDFTDQGFMSTTYSERALYDWMNINSADNVLFKISGKNGKLIESVSSVPKEAEVLFKSGTTFAVESVGKSYSYKLGREITEIILKQK